VLHLRRNQEASRQHYCRLRHTTTYYLLHCSPTKKTRYPPGHPTSQPNPINTPEVKKGQDKKKQRKRSRKNQEQQEKANKPPPHNNNASSIKPLSRSFTQGYCYNPLGEQPPRATPCKERDPNPRMHSYTCRCDPFTSRALFPSFPLPRFLLPSLSLDPQERSVAWPAGMRRLHIAEDVSRAGGWWRVSDSTGVHNASPALPTTNENPKKSCSSTSRKKKKRDDKKKRGQRKTKYEHKVRDRINR